MLGSVVLKTGLVLPNHHVRVCRQSRGGSKAMTDLERTRRIEESVAREEIRDLATRYNSYGDSGLFKPLLELFARDAIMETYDIDGRYFRFDGIDEIAKIFTGTKDLIGERPDPSTPPYIRHFIATHQIDLKDPDRASGRLYFATIMSNGLDHWGRYIDDYIRDEGRWKFAQRRMRMDGACGDSWFAKEPPNEAEDQ
jgi:3-phenylpropionate/cinnamic acid dioxygenase small subunit